VNARTIERFDKLEHLGARRMETGSRNAHPPWFMDSEKSAAKFQKYDGEPRHGNGP
jgi:hypothetical protein